jgi:hypothetical protein
MKIDTSIITRSEGGEESAKFVAEICGPTFEVRKVLLALSDMAQAFRALTDRGEKEGEEDRETSGAPGKISSTGGRDGLGS